MPGQGATTLAMVSAFGTPCTIGKDMDCHPTGPPGEHGALKGNVYIYIYICIYDNKNSNNSSNNNKNKKKYIYIYIIILLNI